MGINTIFKLTFLQYLYIFLFLCNRNGLAVSGDYYNNYDYGDYPSNEESFNSYNHIKHRDDGYNSPSESVDVGVS